MRATCGTHRTWHQPGGLMSRAMGWPMMMGTRQMVHTLARRALRVRVASASHRSLGRRAPRQKRGGTDAEKAGGPIAAEH